MLTGSRLRGNDARAQGRLGFRLLVWDMPILFLLVILIRGGEWLLRRKWGVV